MGKFDKYKKQDGSSKLEKYKKTHGSTIKTAGEETSTTIQKKSRPLRPKDKLLKKKKEEGNNLGTIFIVVLGLMNAVVWVLVLIKLFSQ